MVFEDVVDIDSGVFGVAALTNHVCGALMSRFAGFSHLKAAYLHSPTRTSYRNSCKKSLRNGDIRRET